LTQGVQGCGQIGAHTEYICFPSDGETERGGVVSPLQESPGFSQHPTLPLQIINSLIQALLQSVIYSSRIAKFLGIAIQIT